MYILLAKAMIVAAQIGLVDVYLNVWHQIILHYLASDVRPAGYKLISSPWILPRNIWEILKQNIYEKLIVLFQPLTKYIIIVQHVKGYVVICKIKINHSIVFTYWSITLFREIFRTEYLRKSIIIWFHASNKIYFSVICYRTRSW